MKNDDGDGNVKGGHRFTLSDEIRLQNCLYDLIREEYTSGASVIQIKNEIIKMELDKYTGSYTVAERKKNDALNSLVESNRLIILPQGDRSIETC
jgi:hypothetical protein